MTKIDMRFFFPFLAEIVKEAVNKDPSLFQRRLKTGKWAVILRAESGLFFVAYAGIPLSAGMHLERFLCRSSSLP